MVTKSFWIIGYAFLALTILYVTFETIWGWTPGRRVRLFRLVDVTGERPSRSRLLARCLIRLGWVAIVELAILALLSFTQKREGKWPTGAEFRDFVFSCYAFLGFVGPAIAVISLYLSALCIPGRRPFHDSLTGVSWFERRRPEIEPSTFLGPDRSGSVTSSVLRVRRSPTLRGWDACHSMSCGVSSGRGPWEPSTRPTM